MNEALESDCPNSNPVLYLAMFGFHHSTSVPYKFLVLDLDDYNTVHMTIRIKWIGMYEKCRIWPNYSKPLLLDDSYYYDSADLLMVLLSFWILGQKEKTFWIINDIAHSKI